MFTVAVAFDGSQGLSGACAHPLSVTNPPSVLTLPPATGDLTPRSSFTTL